MATRQAYALYEEICKSFRKDDCAYELRSLLPSRMHLGVDFCFWPPASPLLLEAAQYGRLECVRYLLVELDCDVNVTSKRKQRNGRVDPENAMSALHKAAFRGHIEVVTELLAHNASTSCRNSLGETPLDSARTGRLYKQQPGHDDCIDIIKRRQELSLSPKKGYVSCLTWTALTVVDALPVPFVWQQMTKSVY